MQPMVFTPSREIDEFWQVVVSTTADGPCLEWPGGRNPKGYGVTKRCGENLAPRAVWVAACGPIPPGLLVCHTCDNPPCCRPAHLYLGTHKDNADDAVERGLLRVPTGERHGRCTISSAQVDEMRRRHDGGESFSAIAREYGVHHVTVSRICRRLRRTA